MRPLVTLVVSACWIGAALLLAGAVAPAAFAVLPSRALAGALVGRVLPAVFLSGLIGGCTAVVLDLIGPRFSGAGVRAVLAVVWAASCAVAQFVVSARIERLRAAAGVPIDMLALGDPRRVAFGRLHGASVGLLAVAMIAAVSLGVLAGLAARSRE
jgi:hypothetical protein